MAGMVKALQHFFTLEQCHTTLHWSYICMHATPLSACQASLFVHLLFSLSGKDISSDYHETDYDYVHTKNYRDTNQALGFYL